MKQYSILFPSAHSLVVARGRLASRERGPNGPPTFRETIPRTLPRQRRGDTNPGRPNGPQPTKPRRAPARAVDHPCGGWVANTIIATVNFHVTHFGPRLQNQNPHVNSLGPGSKSHMKVHAVFSITMWLYRSGVLSYHL